MEPGYHQPTAQPRKIRNITLKKGKCVQDIEQLKYNKVNTCIYFQANWMKGIILFLYDTFVSLESLIGLSAFIIHMVFMDDSDLYFLHTGVVLFLNFLGYGVVNILNERSRHIGDNKVNKQMTRKY